MLQYIVSLSVLRYRVSRFFTINLNDKKVFIPMKKISIDFPTHQFVPLPLYCSLLRKNAHHVSCRVFFYKTYHNLSYIFIVSYFVCC